MSPKCPKCGFEGAMESSPMGRPKKVDDKKVAKLKRKGLSLAEIAAKLGITRSAVQHSLRRTKA